MSLILDANRPGAIEQAAALIRCGELVAFPTDTLYGVGASITNDEAIDRLYLAKMRSRKKGIPVLLSSKEDLDTVAVNVPPEARALIEKYWPGPLTLVLQKRSDLAAGLTPNQGIAVRVPDNDIARRLIRGAGGAIAASSANKSGSSPALTASEANTAFEGSLAAVLDGGAVPIGVASTILDFTSEPPRLIRSGPIQAADLALGNLKPA